MFIKAPNPKVQNCYSENILNILGYRNILLISYIEGLYFI